MAIKRSPCVKGSRNNLGDQVEELQPRPWSDKGNLEQCQESISDGTFLSSHGNKRRDGGGIFRFARLKSAFSVDQTRKSDLGTLMLLLLHGYSHNLASLNVYAFFAQCQVQE